MIFGVQIEEFRNARQQVIERLKSIRLTRPVAISLVELGISALARLGTPEDRLRELSEKAIALHKNTKVSMPSPDQIANILGYDRNDD